MSVEVDTLKVIPELQELAVMEVKRLVDANERDYLAIAKILDVVKARSARIQLLVAEIERVGTAVERKA